VLRVGVLRVGSVKSRECRKVRREMERSFESEPATGGATGYPNLYVVELKT
jgi:hypothetical protein